MPRINIFRDLIQPIGELMQKDADFAGINIFYDRSRTKRVPRELIPAINYFVMPPIEDYARGSLSASLQTRRKVISLGFGCWYFAESDAALDEGLWEMVGTVEDWMHEHVDFSAHVVGNPRDSHITINDVVPLTDEPDYSLQEAGGGTGTYLIVVPFQILCGPGF